MASGKRQRVLRWVIILAMGILLAACDGSAEPVQESAPEAPQEAAPAEEVAPPPAEEQAPPPAEEAQPPAEDQPPPPPVDAAPGNCVETNPHPIGQSIADTYDTTTYDQVMIWFCDGSTFDDILLALETNDLTGVPVEDLLALRAAGTDWDQIWQDLGLVE
jgi:hypothetical protein